MNTNHTTKTARPVRTRVASFLLRFSREHSGQTLALAAVAMTTMIGLSGFGIDVGRAYVVKSQLQNSTNAAALAAAGFIDTSSSSSTNTSTQASAYGDSGNNSTTSNGVTTSAPVVQSVCVSALMSSGTTCSSSSAPNAVRVTQTATMKTYFMGLFGKPSLTISTSALATTTGGNAQQWNVAIVLDATGSMNNVDSNCGTGVTQFTCATNAIKTMLASANPCQPGYSSCATANANLHVALFSFPGISTDTVSDDTTSCQQPNYMNYSLPLTNSTSYSPLTYAETTTSTHNGHTTTSTSNWTATYEIVPFSSDYYSSTASTHLNTSSTLVKTVSNCMTPISSTGSYVGALNGAPDNGGVTYYAPAIYAAQAALLAEQTANPGTQNALIFLSDGQANIPAAADDFPSETNPVSTLTSGQFGYNNLTGNGTYPDTKDECQQAIVAAQSAAAAGTRVYAVAYGAESQGCSYTVGSSGSSGSYGTDSTTVATGTNAPFTATTITPCLTMENIASSLDYFYSDFNQTNSGNGVDANCVDNSHPVSALSDILASIARDFLTPRLLPANASYTVVSN